MAGDGGTRFVGTLSAEGLAEGDSVRYYLTATDGAGNEQSRGFAFDPLVVRVGPPAAAVAIDGEGGGSTLWYVVGGAIALGLVASLAGGGGGGGRRVRHARGTEARAGDLHPMNSPSTRACAVCAAALMLAGCTDDDDGGEERIHVPQLRMVDDDAMPLTLGAPARIDERNREAFERASLAIERTVWVRPGEGAGPLACFQLGRAGPSGAGDGAAAAPESGFSLELDPDPTALTTLVGLNAGDPVSLLVSWSVPASVEGSEGSNEPILLDAAEYRFERAAFDASVRDVIVLRRPDDAPEGDGADGTIPAAELAPGEPPCATPGGPLGGRSLAVALNPDDDALDSLREINAGLPVEAAASPSIPVVDGGGNATVLEGIEVIVVADEPGVRRLDEPLAPTWRIDEDMSGRDDGTLLLLPAVGATDRQPLDLRVAVTSDGVLLLEVVIPADFDRDGRILDMDANYLSEEGGQLTQFGCDFDGQNRLTSPTPLNDGGGTNGLFITGDRVLARCSSPEFGTNGEGVGTDGTFILTADVAVETEDESPPGSGGSAAPSEPLRWNIDDGTRVLIYRGGARIDRRGRDALRELLRARPSGPDVTE